MTTETKAVLETRVQRMRQSLESEQRGFTENKRYIAEAWQMMAENESAELGEEIRRELEQIGLTAPAKWVRAVIELDFMVPSDESLDDILAELEAESYSSSAKASSGYLHLAGPLDRSTIEYRFKHVQELIP